MVVPKLSNDLHAEPTPSSLTGEEREFDILGLISLSGWLPILRSSSSPKYPTIIEFLSLYGSADASFTVILLEGTVLRIDNICRLPTGSQCPLLYFAFDDGLYDTCQASLEASSLSAVVYSKRSGRYWDAIKRIIRGCD
jgi:hypothetical protein